MFLLGDEGFDRVLLQFYWVLLGKTIFLRFGGVLPGFTGFYMFLWEIYWVPMFLLGLDGLS